MQALRDKILNEGTVIGSEIVKVDGFLNHKIDVEFLNEIGKEFAQRFGDVQIDKILTIEASGIAVAAMTSIHFGYPQAVFAKKTKPNTMGDNFYMAEAKSFTKGTVSNVVVSKDFLNAGERVLILDDFMAHGEAATALTQIVEMAGAEVVGIGAVIEKCFQGGSEKLRSMGYRVESLAEIAKIEDGVITWK